MLCSPPKSMGPAANRQTSWRVSGYHVAAHSINTWREGVARTPALPQANHSRLREDGLGLALGAEVALEALAEARRVVADATAGAVVGAHGTLTAHSYSASRGDDDAAAAVSLAFVGGEITLGSTTDCPYEQANCPYAYDYLIIDPDLPGSG